MNIDRGVLLVGSVFVLVGVMLSAIVSEWFLILPAFVGLNMLQSVFTGFCPAAMILKRLGLPAGSAF